MSPGGEARLSLSLSARRFNVMSHFIWALMLNNSGTVSVFCALADELLIAFS